MRLFAYEQATQLYPARNRDGGRSRPDPDGRRAAPRPRAGPGAGPTTWRPARPSSLRRGGTTVPDPRLFAEAALAMRAWPLGIGVLDDQPSGFSSEALELLGEEDVGLRARTTGPPRGLALLLAGTADRRSTLAEEAVDDCADASATPRPSLHVLSNAQLAIWGPDIHERDLGWMEEPLALMDEIGQRRARAAGPQPPDRLPVELDDLPARGCGAACARAADDRELGPSRAGLRADA